MLSLDYFPPLFLFIFLRMQFPQLKSMQLCYIPSFPEVQRTRYKVNFVKYPSVEFIFGVSATFF